MKNSTETVINLTNVSRRAAAKKAEFNIPDKVITPEQMQAEHEGFLQAKSKSDASFMFQVMKKINKAAQAGKSFLSLTFMEKYFNLHGNAADADAYNTILTKLTAKGLQYEETYSDTRIIWDMETYRGPKKFELCLEKIKQTEFLENLVYLN